VRKPILDVEIETLDARKRRVRSLFDTGAHPTILRESCLPEGAALLRSPVPRPMRTAAAGGRLTISGGTILSITIGDRLIEDEALVSPDLAQELLIGAGTMQKWDITIRNRNGRTRVEVGRDLRDPDIQEVG
jgi:hypothetical protein